MRRLLSICTLMLLLAVSGCNWVREDDLSDLQSTNAVAKREALGRIAKGPPFPLNLLPTFKSNGNEEHAVNIMVNMLREGNETKETQLSLLEALGRIGKRAGVPSSPLIDKLHDRDPEICQKAIAAVAVAKCQDALPTLVKLLDEEKNKYIVIWALGELGNSAAVPRLNQLLASADEYERYNAQIALAKIGGGGPTGGLPAGKAPLMSDKEEKKGVVGDEEPGSTGPGIALAMAERGSGTDRVRVNEKKPSSPTSKSTQRQEASPTRQSSAMQTAPENRAKPISSRSPERAHTAPKVVERGVKRSGLNTTAGQRETAQNKGPEVAGSAEDVAVTRPEALALAMGTQPSRPNLPPPETKTVNYRQNPVGSGEAGTKKVVAHEGGLGVSEEGAALYLQGLALQKEGSLDEAKEMYEAALRVSPNIASAWNNIGTIHMNKKNYGSAIIAFQKALRINPNDADPYYNLACLHALQRNANQSLSYLKKAVLVDKEVRKWARIDDDLKNLRSHSEFQRIIQTTTDL